MNPTKVNHNSIGVVSNLHVESFHLLIPKNWSPTATKKKSMWSWGGDDEVPVEISLNLLANQTVGSWGGSLESFRALSAFFEWNANVVEIKKEQRGNPQIPVLLVGGQPYKAVQDLLDTGKYHLVSINYNELAIKALSTLRVL